MRNCKTLHLICLITFLDFLAAGVIGPLVFMQIDKIGASYFMMGLLASVYTLEQILSGPIVGCWGDVHGYKPLLTLLFFICSCCYFFLGLTNNLYYEVAVILVLGLAKHTEGISKALVAEITPKLMHCKAYSMVNTFGILGSIVGPIISGFFAEDEEGFFYMSCLASTLLIVNMVLTSAIDDTNCDTLEELIFSMLGNIQCEFTTALDELKSVDWNCLWHAYLIHFIFGISTSLFTELPLIYTHKFDLPDDTVGIILAYMNFLSVISSLFVSNITAKIYGKDTNLLLRLSHTFLLLAISITFLVFSNNLILSFFVMVPCFFLMASLGNASMEFILLDADKAEKGFLMGAANSVMAFGESFSPLIAVLIKDKYGDETLSMAPAIPAFLGAILSFTFKFYDWQ